jgi:hypothetical protein
LEAQISASEYDDTALATRVTATETRLTSAEGRVTALESGKEDLTNKAAAISAADAADTDTYTSAAAVIGYVGSVATDLEAQISASEYDDTALATRVTAVETGKIPNPPVACADTTNSCVLTTDATNFVWEVIAR